MDRPAAPLPPDPAPAGVPQAQRPARPGPKPLFPGRRGWGSAPPTPARHGPARPGPARLTQRAAMRVLHHPRQNNSDCWSLPSPAELCAREGPARAGKSAPGRRGGRAVGVGNWKRAGGWNPGPGAGAPGRVPVAPGQQSWNPERLSALQASPGLGCNPNHKTTGQQKNAFHLQGLRKVLDFGGGGGGRKRGRLLGPLPHIPGPCHWPDPPRAQSEKYEPRAIKLFIEPF